MNELDAGLTWLSCAVLEDAFNLWGVKHVELALVFPMRSESRHYVLAACF